MKNYLFTILALFSTVSFGSGFLTGSGAASAPAIGGGVTGADPGSVLFIDVNSKLAQDNAKFYWDDVNFKLGIGTAVPRSQFHLSDGMALHASLAPSSVAQFFDTKNSTNVLELIGKGQTEIRATTVNGSLAAPTASITGDNLLYFGMRGYDGTAAVTSAEIIAKVNGTVSASIVPTDLNFGTMDSSGALLTRFQVKSSGVLNVAGYTIAGLVHNDSSGNLSSSTLVNADVSASAAIAYSKLATLNTGSIVLGNAGTPTATALSGDVTVGATGVTAIGATKVTNAMLAGSIDLTTKVTGALPVGNGGTGLTAGTSGGIPYYSSTSTIASSALLTANALILGGGAATTPASLGSLGTTTTLLHGNAAGAPTFGAVSLTADVSGVLPIANGGTAKALTLVNGGVVYADADSFEMGAVGVAGQNLRSAGAAAPAFSWGNIISAKSADYTVTDTDGIGWVMMTTSNTDRVVTLPSASTNTDRTVCVKKIDSGTGTVLLDGAGAETVDGIASKLIISNNEFICVKDNGTTWFMTDFGVNTVSSVTRLRSNGLGLTPGATANITTAAITLAAGQWELRGTFGANPAATTVINNIAYSVSSTSGNLSGTDTLAVPTSGEARGTLEGQAGADKEFTVTLPPSAVTIAAGGTTTFYLTAAVDFTTSTCVGYGSITARRISP